MWSATHRRPGHLGLVEAELVLAEGVVFLDGPPASAYGDEHAEMAGVCSGTKQ